MLLYLARPLVFVSLLLAFVCSLLLRATAIRLAGRSLGLSRRGDRTVDLRRDVDPFGAVGAAIGGIGWGRMLSVDEVPRWQGRGRAALVFLAGPLSCIVLAELLLAVHVAFRGVTGTFEDVLLTFAVSVLEFGLLALIPIPPLDGFGVLYFAMRKPGPGIAWMRLWFEEKNLGVVVLVALSLIPFPGSILGRIVNLISIPFLAPWTII